MTLYITDEEYRGALSLTATKRAWFDTLEESRTGPLTPRSLETCAERSTN